MIQRPVCVKCAIEMRCSKNGRIVKSLGHGELGYHHGDEYVCPTCGFMVIVGFGQPMGRNLLTEEELNTTVEIA